MTSYRTDFHKCYQQSFLQSNWQLSRNCVNCEEITNGIFDLTASESLLERNEYFQLMLNSCKKGNFLGSGFSIHKSIDFHNLKRNKDTNLNSRSVKSCLHASGKEPMEDWRSNNLNKSFANMKRVLRIQMAVEYFWRFSRCVEKWWNNVTCVWNIFPISSKQKP